MAVDKSTLSVAVLALIAAGVSAPVILGQFLYEKEADRLTAYRDSKGLWTICKGLTTWRDKPIQEGRHVTAEQCDTENKRRETQAIAWVEHNVKVPLTATQKAGVASFCYWNLGVGNCTRSTFWRELNAGNMQAACEQIKRWIYDSGRDCRIRTNHCAGQPVRRAQESALTCWGVDELAIFDKTVCLSADNGTFTRCQSLPHRGKTLENGSRRIAAAC
ncbi:lysozyme [Candidatus Regiella insecticola]|uniref:Lysozyme n=1 Tax=Candidatus Regiella insecticola TaxID=138073 RepID=A0A6L2ZS42_9ENTR|nr:lysozyme [Candidatus Regiella insecticola]